MLRNLLLKTQLTPPPHLHPPTHLSSSPPHPDTILTLCVGAVLLLYVCFQCRGWVGFRSWSVLHFTYSLWVLVLCSDDCFTFHDGLMTHHDSNHNHNSLNNTTTRHPLLHPYRSYHSPTSLTSHRPSISSCV